MIQHSTIQAVRDLPIDAVIGHYITLKKKGGNWLAHSPFTDEKTPSFTVFKKNQNFKCFSSGHQGDGIAFVMLYQKLEFYEAVKEIAHDHGVILEYEDLTPEQVKERQKAYDERKEIMNVMEYAKNHFLNNDIPEQWLKDRKYKSDLLTPFQVGYGSGQDTLIDEAKKAGLSEDLLKKAGLVRMVKTAVVSTDQAVWSMVDAYRGRVIFPFLDVRGNCISFIARYNGDDPEEAKRKYINSPGDVWEKSRHLYGLYQALESIKKANKAFLVEGPTDVISMHRWGLDNTVCPGGTALTDDQCKLLRRFTDNVTLVPDNDLSEDKKSNPGLEAMARNAITLLNNGLHVSVLIPGDIHKKGEKPKNTDPDTFLRKCLRSAQVEKWLKTEERYIEDYLVKVCMTKSAIGAKEKAEAVKEMGAVIEAIQDDTFRSAYYDNVANDWPHFKKNYKLQKRKTEAELTDIKKLQKEQRDTFFKNNYYEEDGAYWAYEQKSKKQISNFTFEAIFCVFHMDSQGQMDLKYVLRLKSQFGRKRLAVISSDDFCGSQSFKKQVHRKHGFFWYGNDVQLDNIKNVKLLGIPEARELERVGWNKKNQFWVWSNGLYYNKEFYPIDEYGITTHARKIHNIDAFKNIPPESQVKIESTIYVLNTVGEFIDRYGLSDLELQIERGAVSHVKFFYLPYGKAFRINVSDDSGNPFKENSKLYPCKPENKWTFEQWASSMLQVYPENGEILVAYYVGTVFSDIIFEANFGYFPLLFLFGKRQSGKSTAARSIMWMFGEPPMEDGINLASGSTSTGMQRSMDSSTNHPFWGNEYKNSIHKNTIEALKGVADRSGKLTGIKSGGNETRIAKPRGSGMISGQDLPTQDPALLSRCLVQEYDDSNRAEESILKAFKNVEITGIFTHITCELLDYRQYIQDHYQQLEPQVSHELLEEVRQQFGEVDDRSLRNMTSVITPIKILMDNTDLKFPFTYEDLKERCYKAIKLTISIQHQSDEVEQYFHVLQSLANLRKIEEDVHFRVKIEADCTKLYLRTRNIHGLYRQQAKSEGITALDQAVVGQYLRKHRSFIKHQNGGVTFKKLPNRTSAFVFNYDMLVEQGIEFQSGIRGDLNGYNKQVKDKDALYDILKNLDKRASINISNLKIKLERKLSKSITQVRMEKLLKKVNAKLAKENLKIEGLKEDNTNISIQESLPF